MQRKNKDNPIQFLLRLVGKILEWNVFSCIAIDTSGN